MARSGRDTLVPSGVWEFCLAMTFRLSVPGRRSDLWGASSILSRSVWRALMQTHRLRPLPEVLTKAVKDSCQ